MVFFSQGREKSGGVGQLCMFYYCILSLHAKKPHLFYYSFIEVSFSHKFYAWREYRKIVHSLIHVLSHKK